MEKIDSKENLIRLIRQYQNLVFSICLKMTGDYFAAEDLTQDTFVAVYQYLGKVSESAMNGVRSESDGELLPCNGEKAWICRIAANKCIDYKRAAARKMMPASADEVSNQEAAGRKHSEQNEPLRQVLNQEVIAELKRCCDALAPPYKEVAREYFVEGKTSKEISEQSGVGLKTTQTRIYRAREMLKKIYRKEMLRE